MRQFKKILYVHDESSRTARATLEQALVLAKQNGGQVDLINVSDQPSPMFTSYTLILLRSKWEEQAKKSLQKLLESIDSNSVAEIKVIEGRPHIEIIREVIRKNYDLVIKPIGPSGVIDRLLGRLDMRLLRNCPCPVWLSKGESSGHFKNVLAAVDGGDPENQQVEDALNRQILELAFSLCADNKAKLHVGHAWQVPFLTLHSLRMHGLPQEELDTYLRAEKKTHRDWLKQLMRKSVKWVGQDIYDAVKQVTHLRKGVAGTQIPKLILKTKSDVIVMGTVARTGIAGLAMGNTAEQILDQVTCSVLAVKPPGFESQIGIER